jgi:hypothetical protein
LSDRTITDFERGAREPHENNKRAIQAAFESAGVRFAQDRCVCLPAVLEGQAPV